MDGPGHGSSEPCESVGTVTKPDEASRWPCASPSHTHDDDDDDDDGRFYMHYSPLASRLTALMSHVILNE